MSETKPEAKERIEAFIKDYGELVEKHKVDFVMFPMFVPDGNNGFRVVIQQQPVDTEQMAQKSPFVAGK